MNHTLGKYASLVVLIAVLAFSLYILLGFTSGSYFTSLLIA